MEWSFEERKQAFVKVGQKLTAVIKNSDEGQSLSPAEKALWEEMKTSADKNAWFTPENVKSAMEGIAAMLTPEALDNWLNAYPALHKKNANPKTIAVIMAGNIPFVGFHDMLCVLLSGHRFLGKLSSQDKKLPVKFGELLFESAPEMGNFVVFSEGIIKEFDAVIATGSNNSARYFEYYFGRYPHIIRKNRNSMAILTGDETPEDLRGLGADIFQYFGMGCRNVSKIMVPGGFDFTPLLDSFSSWENLKNHSKFCNNYEYQKAIFLVNQRPHLDTGFVLLAEDERLVSPLAVVHYEYYTSLNDVESYLTSHFADIQCVVAGKGVNINSVKTLLPVETQKPGPQDYADGVDTLKFLMKQ